MSNWVTGFSVSSVDLEMIISASLTKKGVAIDKFFYYILGKDYIQIITKKETEKL